MLRIVLFVFLLPLFETPINAQKVYPISFEPIETKETCSGECAFIRVRVDDSNYEIGDIQPDIKLTNLGSNLAHIKVFFYNDIIQTGESFSLKSYEDFQAIHIEFLVDQNIKNPYLEFRQDITDRSLTNKILIQTGIFNFSSKDSIINTSEACTDSIFINFPFVGTQTDLYLSKLENGIYKTYLNTTYYCCWGNRIKIAAIPNQRFRFGLTGCYSRMTYYEFETR